MQPLRLHHTLGTTKANPLSRTGSRIRVRCLLLLSTLLAAQDGAQAQFASPIVLPGDRTFAVPAGDQTNVTFARGAGATLMVWEDRRADLTQTQSSHGTATRITDIYASRIDDFGNALDAPPIVVTHAAFAQTNPKVAWNGQSWLVVWTSRSAGPSFSTQGVYGARISATGQVLDAPPLVIDDTQGFDEREAVVASDGNMWAVVWFANIASGTDGVRGCLLDPAGTPDTPRTFFQTSASSGNYYVPANFELAFAGGRYLLVSEHWVPGPSFDRDILGQFFDTNLVKIGSEFAIATNAGWDQNRAAIASDGAGFFVTWYDAQLPGQVRGSPVSATGAVAVPDGTIYESGLGVEVHATAGFDGVNWIAAWEQSGSTFSETLIRVARVSAAGALLPGSPVTASGGNWSKYDPAVATLSGAALVAWSDERNVSFTFSNAPVGIDTTDLYGAIIDAAGSPAADRSLLLSPPAQTRPAIAGNAASGYLVTFLSETAATGSVMAQRVSAGGAPLDPQPVVVTTGTRLIRNPEVAFDGTLWLVVWEVMNPAGSAGTANVFARRIGSNGIPIDPSPILLMSGNSPDVAAVNGVFLVVSTTNPGHFRSIHGQRVRGGDGAVLDATPLVIGTYYSVEPDVTAFADRWLVVWQEHPSHDSSYSSIRANFVLAGGTTLGEFIAGGGAGSTSRAPSVSANATVALVSWSDGADIRARRIQSDGTLLDASAGFLVSNAFNTQFSPATGFDGMNWLVAWNDFRAHTNVLDGGVGDTYGAGVDPNGTVLDPGGVAIANDFRVPEAMPAVAGDLGVAITAYAMLRDESPFGMFRIAVESSAGSTVAASFCSGDGSSAACPCGNGGYAGNGCANSYSARGARLASSGRASASTDSLVLTATGVPGPGLFFQGDGQTAGGMGSAFGDGLLCVSGAITRLGVVFPTGSAASYPGGLTPVPIHIAGATVAGDVRHYQFWYRDAGETAPGISFCTPSAFNLTQGLTITWEF